MFHVKHRPPREPPLQGSRHEWFDLFRRPADRVDDSRSVRIRDAPLHVDGLAIDFRHTRCKVGSLTRRLSQQRQEAGDDPAHHRDADLVASGGVGPVHRRQSPSTHNRHTRTPHHPGDPVVSDLPGSRRRTRGVTTDDRDPWWIPAPSEWPWHGRELVLRVDPDGVGSRIKEARPHWRRSSPLHHPQRNLPLSSSRFGPVLPGVQILAVTQHAARSRATVALSSTVQDVGSPR